MTSRRRFLLASALAAFEPARALAQTRQARIGILSPRPLAQSSYAPHLVRRLEELGYRDGKTITLEYRSADGVIDRFPNLAAELIERKCQLIFALGAAPARALRDVRPPVPMVFLAVERDPVKAGIVSDLRRPDGDSTGVYIPQEAMVVKRIELLREVVVPLRRLLVLIDPAGKHSLEVARQVAGPAGVHLTVAEFVRPPYEYEAAFESARKAKAQAILLIDSARFSTDIAAITALVLKHRLPSMGFSIQHSEAGLMFSLSVNQTKAARRTAELGVQVLKGAKPADIPVEQADEFELAVNGKTAKALGVRIPESIMARATRIIS